MAKSYKFWLGTIAVTTLLCGVGGYTGFGVPQSEYNRELARAEAVGLPSQPEKYQRVVADADNAAPIYREASRTWEIFQKAQPEVAKAVSRGSAELPLVGNIPLAAEEDFAMLSNLFKSLDEAARKPTLCFDRKYSDGTFALFPEFSSLKQFVRIRVTHALLLARQRNFPAAYSELEKSAIISRQLGEDNPSLIGLLVQIALRSITVRGLEQTLCLAGRQPDAFQHYQRVMTALGPLPSYREAIRGEYAFCLGTLKMLGDTKKRAEILRLNYDPDLEDPPSQRMTPEDFFLGIPSFRYQMMTAVVRYYRTVYPQLPVDPNDVYSLLKTDKSLEAQFTESHGIMDYLLKILVGSRFGTSPTIARRFTDDRLVELLALNLSRSSRFAIPKDYPRDPFSNKPFRLQATKEGFRIWSVGQDGRDDGGIISSRGGTSGDIVVGYPYVEKSIRWGSSPSGAPTGLPAGSPP